MYMPRIFFNMICKKKISIDDVPEKWISETQELINNSANDKILATSNSTIVEDDIS